MNHKIALTGSTGWFGQVFISHYIERYGLESAHSDLLLFSSDGRDLIYRNIVFNTCCIEEMVDKKVDIIIHSAFLTRDKIADIGEESFKRTNNEITKFVECCINNNDIKMMFLLSSGAAGQVGLEKDLYSKLKLREEDLFKRILKNIFVFRVFSASSNLMPVRNWSALSNFIESAINKENIVVKAKGKVLRSFISFDDLSKIIIATIDSNKIGKHQFDAVSATIDIVTMSKIIAEKMHVSVITDDNYDDSIAISSYIGDDKAIKKFAADYGLVLMSIEEQIESSLNGKLNSNEF